MSGQAGNPAASARQRLLDLARRRGDDFQLVLARYGAERFLYRLGRSEFKDRFVLKGAMLFVIWSEDTYRPTRDLDLLGRFEDLEVGLTVTTDDEEIRKIFEPGTPPVGARLRALKELHDRKIGTYAFIGPLLPQNPESLAEKIKPHADSVLIDRMNYPRKTIGLYRRHHLTEWLEEDFIEEILYRLKKALSGKEVNIC